MSEERPDTEVWEPWVPEVGQLVRIRLNGECKFRYRDGSQQTHFEQSDGQIGRVIDASASHYLGGCRHTNHDPGHRFSVSFDPPVILEQGHRYRHTLVSHCFAALELEPLPPPPDPEAGRGAP